MCFQYPVDPERPAEEEDRGERARAPPRGAGGDGPLRGAAGVGRGRLLPLQVRGGGHPLQGHPHVPDAHFQVSVAVD